MGDLKIAWFTLLVCSVTVTACSALRPSGSSPQSGRNSGQLSKSEYRATVEGWIQQSNSLDDLKSIFTNAGYDVRIRQNGDLWATKEIPAAFPTSMVYDSIIRPAENGFELVRAEVFGKGP